MLQPTTAHVQNIHSCRRIAWSQLNSRSGLTRGPLRWLYIIAPLRQKERKTDDGGIGKKESVTQASHNTQKGLLAATSRQGKRTIYRLQCELRWTSQYDSNSNILPTVQLIQRRTSKAHAISHSPIHIIYLNLYSKNAFKFIQTRKNVALWHIMWQH